MDFFSRRPCKSLFVLLMLFAAGRGDVQAAAITWTGTTSSSWGTATNWTGINTPPQSNDSLIFGTGAGGTLLNNLTSGPIFNVAGLTFSAGAGAFVINSQSLGNGFSLTGDVLNSSTTGVLQTINNSFSLSGTRTFTTTATGAGGNLLLGGTIDGSGGLTAAGGGSVMLTGANTYSGGTTVNSGATLQVGDGNVSGSVTGNITDNGSLVFNRADSPVYGGIISGSGSLSLIGTGTVSLTGANNYSGGTTIGAAARLQFGNGGTGGSVAGNISVVSNGMLVFNRSDNFSFAGVISGGGSLRVTGTGIATLTGASNFSGGTQIDNGATLQIGDGTASPNGTGSITGLISDSGTLVFNRAADYTFGGSINGTGVLALNVGVLRLTAAQSNFGQTQINNGSALVATVDSAVSASSVVNLSAAGSRLDLSNHSQFAAGLLGPGRIYSFDGTGQNGSAGSLTVLTAAGQSYIFSGSIGDIDPKFSFTKMGAGTQIFSGTSSYTGGTTITQGTLQFATSTSPNTSPGNTMTVNPGATLAVNYGGGSDVTPAQVAAMLQVAKTTFVDATAVFAFDTTNAGAGGTSTYANALTRNSSITKLGFGTLVLTSVGNTYAGATTVSGGKLSVGVANAIPATSNASIGPAGTLDLGSFNNSVAGVQLTGGSITGSGVLTSASAFDLQVGTVSAGLGGSAGLTKTSAGTVTLSSSNSTYTGATTLNGGTLAIGSLNAIPSGSSLTIASGATLDLGTFNDSVAGVQLNGGNITGTGQLTSTGTYNAQSGSVSANLAGAAGLTQAGPGTLTLGGSNNIYTGPTAINGGTLLLTGKITGSPISVAAGGVLSETAAGSLSGASALTVSGGAATLAGTNNTYSGATTINSGTLQSPSDAALSPNSALAVNGTGTLALSYGGAADYTEAQVAALLAKPSTTFGAATATVGFDTANLGAGGTASYSTALTMGGGVTKLGVGTLILSGANTFTGQTSINAGTLQLGNGGGTGQLPATGAVTNNGSLVFNRSNTVAQGIDFGPISGSGQLIKNGSGTLILSGANTYTGETFVNSGTLQLTSSLAGGLTANNGANLTVSADPNGRNVLSIGGNLTLNTTVANVVLSNPPLSVAAGQPMRVLNYAGTLSGGAANFTSTQLRNPVFSTATAGQVNVVFDTKFLTWSGGTSAWDVNGAANWNSGQDQFFLGDAVTFNDSAANKTVTVDTVLVPNSVTISHTAGTYTLSGAGGILAGVTHSGAGDAAINIPITGTGGLSKTGAGTLTLAAANAYTGPTQIQAGAVSLTGTLSGTAITASGSGILSQSATGAITGTSSFTQAGSGTSVLAGTNTYINLTNVSGGTLSLPGSLRGGLVLVSSTGVFSQTATGTLSGVLPFTMLASATATSILAGTNSNTGGFSVNGGMLSLTGSINGSSVSTGNTGIFSETATGTLTGSTSLFLGGGNSVLAGANTNTGSTQISSGTLSLTGSISGSSITTMNSGVFSQTAAGSMTGTAVLDVSAAGATSVLAGTNTLTGGVSVDQGTLSLSGSLNGSDVSVLSPGVFSETATGTISGTKRFLMSARALTSGASSTLAGVNTYTGNTQISGGTLSLSGSLSGTTISTLFTGVLSETATGTISGNKNVSIGGNAGVSSILAGANTYTGATFIGGGTLQVGVGGTTGSLSPASAISNFATLAFNRSNTITQGADFGLISGSGGNVVQLGSGTLVLSGANTYTGSTTVSAGTLEVDGSIATSSGLSVSVGGTVSGAGLVSQLSGAGLVAPGGHRILTGTSVDPSGGLDFTFNITQSGAPTYNNAAASGNDVLHLTDAAPFTLALTSANVITVDFSGATAVLGQAYLGGFFVDPSVADSVLSSATFVYTGLFGAVHYDGLVDVPSAAFATGTVTDDRVMQFTIVAVPEPGTFSLAFVGALGLLLRRRSRR